MKMNIQLGENYRIESDAYNYILKRRKVSDPNHRFSKGIAKETWVDIGYFGKLSHLVNHLIELEIKHSDAETLQDLVHIVRKVGDFTVAYLEAVNPNE
jgi:hypothetical protein